MGIYDFLKKGISVKEAKTAPQRPRERESSDMGGRRLRSFNPATDSYREESAQRVEVYRPRDMADAKELADKLSEGEAVLLDFSAAHEEDAQSILDFICGAAYVLGGDATKVRENMFLVTVRGVEIMVEDR